MFGIPQEVLIAIISLMAGSVAVVGQYARNTNQRLKNVRREHDTKIAELNAEVQGKVANNTTITTLSGLTVQMMAELNETRKALLKSVVAQEKTGDALLKLTTARKESDQQTQVHMKDALTTMHAQGDRLEEQGKVLIDLVSSAKDQTETLKKIASISGNTEVLVGRVDEHITNGFKSMHDRLKNIEEVIHTSDAETRKLISEKLDQFTQEVRALINDKPSTGEKPNAKPE